MKMSAEKITFTYAVQPETTCLPTSSRRLTNHSLELSECEVCLKFAPSLCRRYSCTAMLLVYSASFPQHFCTFLQSDWARTADALRESLYVATKNHRWHEYLLYSKVVLTKILTHKKKGKHKLQNICKLEGEGMPKQNKYLRYL